MTILTNNNQNNIWTKKKISIIGAGVSGMAAAKLGKHIGAEIFISESNSKPSNLNELKKFNFEIGHHSNKVLDADTVIISPGVSKSIKIISDCRNNNIPIISEIEFASLFTTSPILALTGSNGKTTTVNLLYEMCIADGKNALIGGNVGIPFSENVLLEMTSTINNVIHVLELSSFQLEHIESFCPEIAGLLNISEDHMDRYIDFNDYLNTKINIVKNMTESGKIIYNKEDIHLNKLFINNNLAIPFSMNNEEKTYFSLTSNKKSIKSKEKNNFSLYLNETKLYGNHNIQNILAASTMAHCHGISHNAIKESIINFSPIPHRLEWVGKINNINYFNDSKATNIAAAQAAISSFDEKIILILGGLDKGQTDFSQLDPLLKEHTKFIITYGKDGQAIKEQIQSINNIVYIENFKDAILQASEQSMSGDTILLSPACASFDQFSNYEDRGDYFKKIIRDMELELL